MIRRLISILLLFACPLMAQTSLPAGVERVTTVEGITEYRLANGLRAAVRLIAQKFGPIPKPSRTLERTYTVDPPQEGERSVTVQRVGDIQAVYVAYRVPALAHPDSAAVDLVGSIMASSPAGRLHKALVETKKAVQIGGGNRALLEEGVANFLAAVRKEASIEDARVTMLATLDAIPANPLISEELERARADLLRQIELALNDSEQVGMAFSEYSAAGDWRLLFIRRDRIRQATLDDVRRAAATYFKPVSRTVGMFIPVATPVRAEIPRMPDITAIVKDYKGDATAATGEAFDPSPANIESRTARTQLPPGMKLALLPKKTRGATVNVQLRLNYGDQSSLMNLSAAAELTPAILSRGTLKRTRQQIRDEMNRIEANIGVGGARAFTQVTIQTVRESLPDALRLTAELLREPSFPEAEFEQLRQERIAAAEQTRSDPAAIATMNLSRHLNPYPKGDLRYVMTVDERIQELKVLTLDDLKRFHREFFGASHFELAVVGDFDNEGVRKLVSGLFGDWKGTRAFAEIFRPYRELPPSSQTFETPDKANATVVAGMRFRLGDQDPDYPAMVLANYMLGGHSTSRLYTRIRAKDGLSYSVGSSLATTPGDNAADFLISAITAPENASKVEAAMKEELQRALKEGFPADEVAGSKKGWAQTQQVSRSQDPELAGRLRLQIHSNRTMAYDMELQNKVAALTPDQILAALRRHLDVSLISFVKAGDFQKAGGR
jgi:zinc protease